MNKKDFLLAMLVMMIWGFNFSMIKLGVTEVNPLLATAARFVLAVFPLIFFIPKPDVQWRYLIAYGVCFGVGVWGMASWSMTVGLSSGMSSVLLKTEVLLGILAGVFIYKDTFSKQKQLGTVVSFFGLVISILYTNGNVSITGLGLITIAAISWVGTGMIVKAAKVKQVFAFNVWGVLFAPAPLIALAVVLNGPEVLSHAYQVWDWNTTIAVLFQAYPTTLFGYWVWNTMIMKYPLSTVSPLTLLTSVFGLLSGYLLFDEQLSNTQMVACGLFLLGIFLIVWVPAYGARAGKLMAIGKE